MKPIKRTETKAGERGNGKDLKLQVTGDGNVCKGMDLKLQVTGDGNECMGMDSIKLQEPHDQWLIGHSFAGWMQHVGMCKEAKLMVMTHRIKYELQLKNVQLEKDELVGST